MDIEERTGGTATNPHAVTAQFEQELCNYTGAKYAVAVNSCTMAILLALAWHIPEENRYKPKHERPKVSIPRPGYVSVPMSIIHAGGFPEFRDEDWRGSYQLQPYPVYDCARRFTSGMYQPGTFQCVSFHASKLLGIEQGGAVLHDCDDADLWFRRMRFDGRTPGINPKDDPAIGTIVAFHCYMNPSTAAQGLLRLFSLPRHNDDLNNSDYPDLSELPIYK